MKVEKKDSVGIMVTIKKVFRVTSKEKKLVTNFLRVANYKQVIKVSGRKLDRLDLINLEIEEPVTTGKGNEINSILIELANLYEEAIYDAEEKVFALEDGEADVVPNVEFTFILDNGKNKK